jgi:hypothetical protein
MKPNEQQAIDRFMPQVIKQADGCWAWSGSRMGGKSGRYGQTAGAARQVDQYAHRCAYKLFVGPIPEGQLVRHRCNNTICVNPDHLLLGTMVENYKDSLEAGTAPVGTRNGKSIHSTETVREIRRLYAIGMNQRAIGRAVGVHFGTVSDIVRGRRRQYE